MSAVKAHSHKCPSCGKQHVPGFAFCQRCGSPLGLAQDETTAAIYRPAETTVAVDGNDDPEADFNVVRSPVGGQPKSARRAGCAGMLLAMMVAAAVIWVGRGR
ncbi:MAG TPA: zinc-ribbon domain-containing protein [Pirellulales bacterium]|nr:zinc-ribbon domain-containing protein [Pirellulales bacterium]